MHACTAAASCSAMENEAGENAVPLNNLPKEENKSSFDGQALLKQYQQWLRVELAGLCVLMAVVWGFLMLPITFYYLPATVVNIFACSIAIIS